MAAEIRVDPMSPVATTSTGSRPGTDSKPELVNKIEGSAEDINAAVFIPGQDGVLSVSSDRLVEVENAIEIVVCTQCGERMIKTKNTSFSKTVLLIQPMLNLQQIKTRLILSSVCP